MEKLLTNQEKQSAIKAELVTGANPRKLADKYDLHYTTVIKYRNELREGKVESDVIDVANSDAHVLHTVAENIKAQNVEVLPPKGAQAFNDKIDDLVEGVNSLALLDTSFHNTITKLLGWADKQITDDMPLKDWKLIASSVGELHTSIFSKGGVNVNVQQNNGSRGFSSGMVN